MTNRLQYLENLLKQSPKDSFILFALAKEYESQGDEAQTLAFYLRLKEADALYVGLYYHLGKCYERQHDFQLAIETYKTGIEICNKAKDQHAMNELYGALLNLEDPE